MVFIMEDAVCGNCIRIGNVILIKKRVAGVVFRPRRLCEIRSEQNDFRQEEHSGRICLILPADWFGSMMCIVANGRKKLLGKDVIRAKLDAPHRFWNRRIVVGLA